MLRAATAAVADGGEVDLADEETDRPEDCDCWDSDTSLPCWPCFNADFTAPNPAEPGAKEGEEADSE